jgi:gamma-glutamyltranspeptidase/glutathione hydrolase
MTASQLCATTRRLWTALAAVSGLMAVGLASFGGSLTAQPAPDGKTIEARNGLVVTVSSPASDAGLSILQQGGNAVDAAVATAFALAVTHPTAGNIGGGGFMLVHPPAGQGKPAFFDYREMAPAAATADMYANGFSSYDHKAVGVPGTVRGLELAHQRFGKLPWKDVVAPAIKLADGFVVDARFAGALNNVVRSSPNHAELRRVYGKNGGTEQWQAGDTLKLPDLAKTLRLIADQGPNAFYTGPIADLIVAEMKAGGGIISKADLAAYRAKEREPVHGTYRGYDIYGAPPPSSGGIAMVEMLNVLENYDLKKQGRYSPQTLHVMTEAMRRAYLDRARFLGDSDFTSVPSHLTTKEYAKTLANGIDLAHATASASLAPDLKVIDTESEETTHFSVIDKDGMAVSNTYTLEGGYGSKVVVRGAGFLLNNEMGDFNRRPGVTNTRGSIGTPANQIVPGKRMLSSMTPTIVVKDGKLRLVTGSPGGRTIINTVLNVVVNVVDFDMDARHAVDSPRMDHEWFPDQLRVERGMPAESLAKLREMGHKVSEAGGQGDAHSILIDPKNGAYQGAADKRSNGKAAGY